MLAFDVSKFATFFGIRKPTLLSSFIPKLGFYILTKFDSRLYTLTNIHFLLHSFSILRLNVYWRRRNTYKNIHQDKYWIFRSFIFIFMLQSTDGWGRTTTTNMMERRHNGFAYATENPFFQISNMLEDLVEFF